ncbi:MAG: putative ABC transport system ATP-binding protein [Phenylobacterium sp.]|jgi:putative ABC transport system ATP-binding protein
MISASNISKTYQDVGKQVTVFDNLSFTINAGETIALMGQSGAGKSTLLHLLGGFDTVSSGEICIDNTPITRMNDSELSVFRRTRLGMIFQQYNLIPSLTALQNITFVRRLNGLPASDDFTQQLIKVLGLEQRLSHYPAQLSGGEQQRVAIARALAAKPSVLLADEPTGNLDEETAAQVMNLLLKAVELDHVTMVLVTHSQTTANYLQRVWQLKQGQLKQGQLKQGQLKQDQQGQQPC